MRAAGQVWSGEATVRRTDTYGKQKVTASDLILSRPQSALRSMFNIARKQGKLQFVAAFPMQSDGAPRQGFVEPNQFKKILDKLPKHLHPLLAFLYSSGVRVGEAKQIMWPQVDLKAKEIHLEGFQTKNRSGRTAPLSEELVGMLKKQFHRNDGLVFDTNNPERSGPRQRRQPNSQAYIRESIAMKISGHKTANIFSRYDIVDSSDLHAADGRCNEDVGQ